MSDNTAPTNTTDVASDLPQSWKDDPTLIHKLIAGLALVDSTRPVGVLDLVNSAVKTSGNLLDSDTGKSEAPMNDIPTPLFVNSNASESSFYKVKNGWGIQKQGSKIHTFDYEVISNQGLVDRIFGVSLNTLEDAVDKAFTQSDVVEALEKLENLPDVGASEKETTDNNKKRKDLETLIDSKTAAAREKFAHLIVAAYEYIVDNKPDDLVSYVSLAERALKTLSYDVKELIGPRSYIPGVALAMVVDTVATGSAAAVKRKAIKPFNSSSSSSKIVALKELYAKKVYTVLKPRVEFEAEMDQAQIYPGPNDTWAVELLKQAPNMEQLRGMDFEVLEQVVESAPAIDQQKIYEMFAGLRGGGKGAPEARTEMVKAGIDVKDAYDVEKAAKENGVKTENQSEKDIWSSLQERIDGDKKARQEKVDKILEALEKTKKKKQQNSTESSDSNLDAVKKLVGVAVKSESVGDFFKNLLSSGKTPPNQNSTDPSDSNLDTITKLLGGSETSEPVKDVIKTLLGSDYTAHAGPAGMAIETLKVVEKIANANAKQLANDIAATEKAGEVAISEAEGLLEKMKGSTGDDLKNQQDKLKDALASVKAEFGASRMRGMAKIQSELEQMSTQFSETQMNTLKPYESYPELVAGANGGKALRSVALFCERDEPVLTAPRTLLQIPSSVFMTSPDLPFRTTTHRTTSETEMNSFIKSAENSGLGTASKIKERKSKSNREAFNLAIVVGERRNTSGTVREESKNETFSEEKAVDKKRSEFGTEAMISEFTFMPMKSFFLEERGLRLTNFAFNKFQRIGTDKKLAKKFLKTFGSHIPFGTQTMGGVFIRTMKITTTRATEVSKLYKAASKRLATVNTDAAIGKATAGIHVDVFGLGGGKNTASSSISGRVGESTGTDLDAVGEGAKEDEYDASYESNVICFGPKAATADALYQQLMRNNATWTIIDRGDTSSYLPVWELIEFQKGKEQFKDQVATLQSTWEEMALQNYRAQDVDLLSEVMDDDPKTKVLQIVANLATCVVPETNATYDEVLANDFQRVLTTAYDTVFDLKKKPKNLKEFISKAYTDDNIVFVDKFELIETEEYEVADYIYSELVFDDLVFFKPDDSFDAYQKCKKEIISKGKYVHDHLIEACISAVTQTRPDFHFFDKLFDYHLARDSEEKTLYTQLHKKDINNGMCCLHYLAKFADEVLILKVLQQYEENAIIDIVDDDGKNALTYMEERSELGTFVEDFKPEISEVQESDNSTSQKSVKEKILDIFNRRKLTLLGVEKGAKSNRAKKNIRRNQLAANDSTRHVRELNEIIGRIEKWDKNDTLLIEYALEEVGRVRNFAASEEIRFRGYINRWDNEYVQYVHRKAKETFQNIKKDIEIL